MTQGGTRRSQPSRVKLRVLTDPATRSDDRKTSIAAMKIISPISAPTLKNSSAGGIDSGGKPNKGREQQEADQKEVRDRLSLNSDLTLKPGPMQGVAAMHP